MCIYPVIKLALWMKVVNYGHLFSVSVRPKRNNIIGKVKRYIKNIQEYTTYSERGSGWKASV